MCECALYLIENYSMKKPVVSKRMEKASRTFCATVISIHKVVLIVTHSVQITTVAFCVRYSETYLVSSALTSTALSPFIIRLLSPLLLLLSRIFVGAGREKSEGFVMKLSLVVVHNTYTTHDSLRYLLITSFDYIY